MPKTDAVVSGLSSFSNDTHARLCMVFGMRGIGKSACLTEAVNQVFPPNWTRIAVKLTDGTGFNRFILMLFYQLRLPIVEESLENIQPQQIEELFEVFFRKFDSLPTACLLIDDWQFTRTRLGYRDWRFEHFISFIQSRYSFNNNKVIITSQLKFNPPSGVYPIILPPLDHEAIRSIINWIVRSTRVDASPVLIPTELIKRLHGNPLAATIVSQLLERFSVDSILENTQVQERFQNRLIPLLLEQIELNEDERELLSYLSIYNIPFEFKVIEQFSEEKSVELVEALTDYFLIDFDIETGLYEMHPLVREHFQKSIPSETKISYHTLAADYYAEKTKLPNASPAEKGEHVSQVASSLQFEKVQALRSVYLDELRPVALGLFKDRHVKEALKYYEVLDNLYPDDVDIKFHIGLCYAHQEFWADAESFIAKALNLNGDAWWVLAGYGDILAKKRCLGPAEKYLNNALELMDRIKAPQWRYSAVFQSLALVYNKDWHKAEEYYFKAIQSDETSAFAYYAYAKFLFREGDPQYALEQLNIAEKLDGSFRVRNPLKEKILAQLKGNRIDQSQEGVQEEFEFYDEAYEDDEQVK